MVDSPILPAQPGTGTIDLTNLVGMLQSSFVTWFTNEASAAAFAAAPVLALPILDTLVGFGIKLVVSWLVNQVEMQAFFLNTAIRKASQAQDYITAVNDKNGLPPDTSEADYEKAEDIEMQAFRDFVVLSN